MRLEKPRLLDQGVALLFVAVEAVWVLRVDHAVVPLVPPLFQEPWQPILSFVFVGGALLLAASVQPGNSVRSELLSDATRSILAGAVLALFASQGLYLFESVISLGRYRTPLSCPWTSVFRSMTLACPILSLFIMGTTAGNSPYRTPAPEDPPEKSCGLDQDRDLKSAS